MTTASLKTIVINAFVVDSSVIDRTPDGVPQIYARTEDFQLYMITPSGSQFTLETWHPGNPPRQDIDMIPNLDRVVTQIAAALAAQETQE